MAVNIIKSTENMTPAQLYFLTLSPSVEKLSDRTGEIIELDSWCIYEDTSTDKNGNEKVQTILSIKTPDNHVYGTNSATFIKSFDDMIQFFAPHGGVKKILVDGGQSKAGRNFIQCVYYPD